MFLCCGDCRHGCRTRAWAAWHHLWWCLPCRQCTTYSSDLRVSVFSSPSSAFSITKLNLFLSQAHHQLFINCSFLLLLCISFCKRFGRDGVIFPLSSCWWGMGHGPSSYSSVSRTFISLYYFFWLCPLPASVLIVAQLSLYSLRSHAYAGMLYGYVHITFPEKDLSLLNAPLFFYRSWLLTAFSFCVKFFFCFISCIIYLMTVLF